MKVIDGGKSEPEKKKEKIDPQAVEILTEVTDSLSHVDVDEWRRKRQAQANLLRTAKSLWHRIPPALQDRFRRAFLDLRPDIDVDRFQYIIGPQCRHDLIYKALLPRRQIPFHLEKDELIYPIGAQYGWIGRYMEYVKVGEAHLGFHFWSGIWALGAACRRNFKIVGDEDEMFPAMFVFLIGPSGSGKDVAINRATGMLDRMNEYVRYDAGDVSEFEKRTLVSAVDNISPEEIINLLAEHPTYPNMMENATPEYALANLEYCGYQAVPEAMTLFAKRGLFADRIVPVYCRLFDGKAEQRFKNMKGREIRLKTVNFSLIIGSAPTWLRTAISDHIMSGGFIGARCLVIAKEKTNRKIPRRPPLDPLAGDKLAHELVKLATCPLRDVEFSPEAEEFFDSWYLDIPNPHGDKDQFASYLERKDGHLKRLALAIAISNHGDETFYIEVEHAKLAARILLHEERTSFLAMDEMAASEETQQLQKALRLITNNTTPGHGEGSMVKGELFNRMKWNPKSHRDRSRYEMLKEWGKIEEVRWRNGWVVKRADYTVLTDD